MLIVPVDTELETGNGKRETGNHPRNRLRVDNP